jgi:hypothetical protein
MGVPPLSALPSACSGLQASSVSFLRMCACICPSMALPCPLVVRPCQGTLLGGIEQCSAHGCPASSCAPVTGGWWTCSLRVPWQFPGEPTFSGREKPPHLPQVWQTIFYHWDRIVSDPLVNYVRDSGNAGLSMGHWNEA